MAGEMNLRTHYKLNHCREHIKFCTSDAEGDLITLLIHLIHIKPFYISPKRGLFAFYLQN